MIRRHLRQDLDEDNHGGDRGHEGFHGGGS